MPAIYSISLSFTAQPKHSNPTPSEMADTAKRIAKKAQEIAAKDASEANILIQNAVKSYAYTYPLRGIYYFLRHKELSKPLRNELAPLITTGIGVTTLMFLFTYLPQAALLSIFSGPLAVISTIFLVLSESATITNVISKGFFIEDALINTFDGTLLICDQQKLVSQGRVLNPRGAAADVIGRLGKIAKRPFARFTPTAIIRYFMYLPLNFIPVVGPILFLLLQARKFGPAAHARYFQLKGMSKNQKDQWVHERKAEYTGFGIPAMLLEMIPFVGIFFSFTNTVGAALWAADIEKASASKSTRSAATTTNAETPSEKPPAYSDHEF